MNDDIDQRFETIGHLDYTPVPLDPSRRRRTLQDCRRETAYYEQNGIEVFCRPQGCRSGMHREPIALVSRLP